MIFIVWNGLGFLVALFVLVCSFLANLITGCVTGSEIYWEMHLWPLGVSLLVSAMLCWKIGLSLSQSNSRILVDPETVQEFIDSPKHTLFFIKMHWWGPILGIIGIGMIILDQMG